MDKPQTARVCFELIDFVVDRVAGQFPPSERTNLLMGYTHVAITHAHSIIRLASIGADASALALMRPLVEAHLRGLWLYHSASDAQIARFYKGALKFPSWDVILEKLRPQFPDRLFLHAERNYGRMCDFTHGGTKQIGFVIDAKGRVGSNYPVDFMITTMRLSAATLSSHGIIVCLLLDRQAAADEIGRRMIDQLRK